MGCPCHVRAHGIGGVEHTTLYGHAEIHGNKENEEFEPGVATVASVASFSLKPLYYWVPQTTPRALPDRIDVRAILRDAVVFVC